MKAKYHSKSDLYLTQWLIFISSIAPCLCDPLSGGSLLNVVVAFHPKKVEIWYYQSVDINSNLVRICLRTYNEIFDFQRTNKYWWNTTKVFHVLCGFPFCYHLMVAVLAAEEYSRNSYFFGNKNYGLSFFKINII